MQGFGVSDASNSRLKGRGGGELINLRDTLLLLRN